MLKNVQDNNFTKYIDIWTFRRIFSFAAIYLYV